MASNKDKQLIINLFGPLYLKQGQHPLPLPKLVKARLLLAYLLIHYKKSHLRDYLVTVLWPNKPNAQARRHLSQALWHIRQVIPDLIVSKKDTLQVSLKKGGWVDIIAFEDYVSPYLTTQTAPLVALSNLQQAIDLYKDDLLTGYYEDWVIEARETYQRWLIITLQHVLRLQKQTSHYQQALATALRLTKLDPFQENIQREIMRLYVALQRPQTALQYFESYRQQVLAELSLPPEERTVSLAERIAQSLQQGQSVLPISVTVTPASKVEPPLLSQSTFPFPLIGREREKETLLKHILATLKGDVQGGGLLLMAGEAGVGKTYLLKNLVEEVKWHEGKVLWGAGHKTDHTKDFGLLVTIISHHLSAAEIKILQQRMVPLWLQLLSRFIPQLGSLLPSLKEKMIDLKAQQTRLQAAFTQFFSIWSELTPLILFLDNLHQADEATVTLLPELVKHLRGKRVLVIATYHFAEMNQSMARSAQLKRLQQVSLQPSLILEPLKASATAELVRVSLGLKQPAPQFEARIHQKTNGNPLFVLEVLRLLYQQGYLYQDEQGQWATPIDEQTIDYVELKLPKAIRPTIETRLAHLSPLSRDILDFAATLGVKFDSNLLSSITKISPSTLQEAFIDLTHQQFLRQTTATYNFTHDQIQETTYKYIPPSKQINLHRQIGYALEENFLGELETLAYHFQHAQVWDKAIYYTQQTAQTAYKLGDYQTALTACTRLLNVQANISETDALIKIEIETRLMRCKLFWLMADLTYVTDDLNRLSNLIARLNQPLYQIQLLTQQAIYLFRIQKKYESAHQKAQQALQLARQHHLKFEEGDILHILAQLHYRWGNHEQSILYAKQAIEYWPSLGQGDYRLIQLYMCLQTAYSLIGLFEEAQTMAVKIEDLAKKMQDPLTTTWVYESLAGQVSRQGNYAKSITYMQTNIQHAQAAGLIFPMPRLWLNLGIYAISGHQYHLAETAFKQASKLFQPAKNKFMLVHLYDGLTWLYYLTGRYKLAQRFLDDVWGYVESNELSLKIMLYNAQARLHFAQNNLKAMDLILGLIESEIENLQNVFTLGDTHFNLGLYNLAQQQYKQATLSFKQALVYALKYPGRPDRIALYRSYLALSHYQQGQFEEAAGLSTQAVAEAERVSGGEFIQAIFYHHWLIFKTDGALSIAIDGLKKAYQSLQQQLNNLPDPTWQTQFLENVDINRNINQAYIEIIHQNQPVTVQVNLPHRDVPTGRSLTPADLRPVTWTIEIPTDKTITNKVARRQQQLLRLLQEATAQDAAPTIAHLADALQVGVATIGRDLAALRRAGHKVITRGHH